jgi:hypothetical protein
MSTEDAVARRDAETYRKAAANMTTDKGRARWGREAELAERMAVSYERIERKRAGI